MKTKTFSGFAALVLCVAVQASAQTVQYVTLTACSGNNVILVQTNQFVSLVGYDWYYAPTITGYSQDGTIINLSPYKAGSGAVSQSQIPQIFTGLTSISIATNLFSSPLAPRGAVTFQITTPATATVVSNYVPADAIVIPASATGNVQIILESSPDLVNWTAASPGTYGASAGTNRFFRVRAAVSP